jgi:cytosine/adenosine deaminase-related metal-dependent hydrolase
MNAILIENVAILTLDESDRYFERGDILIEGNRLEQVGGNVEERRADRCRRIDGRRFLAAPGLVNAHTHTPGALSAGTQDRASHPAFMWLNQADTSNRTMREVHVSAMLNAAQMMLAGITTCIDHFPAQNFGPEDVAAAVEAYRASGMRTVLGLRIFDGEFADIFPTDRPLPADIARELGELQPLPPRPLREIRDLVESSIAAYHRPEGRVSVFPAPTNPVRCSDELLAMCRDVARQHDTGIHTHLLESRVQATLAQRRYGCTMVEHLERLEFLGPGLSCAHTIWIGDEDIDRLAATGTIVVHNPESNLKLGTGIAPIAKMVARGVVIALGTDGSVTNDNLVLHEAIRLAAMLGRVSEPDRSKWVTARQALGMATDGGARATRLAHAIGRLQPGYCADVVLYDLHTPVWTPLNDPVQQMVFAETGGSVHTVIIDGEIVVEDRRIVAFDAEQTMAEARPMLNAIRTRNARLHAFARRVAEVFP